MQFAKLVSFEEHDATDVQAMKDPVWPPVVPSFRFGGTGGPGARAGSSHTF